MRLLDQGGKLWEGDQEKYSKQGLFSKVCLLCIFKLVPSPLIRVKSPPLPGRGEGHRLTKGNL